VLEEGREELVADEAEPEDTGPEMARVSEKIEQAEADHHRRGSDKGLEQHLPAPGLTITGELNRGSRPS
jgi:hypothetical protein